MRRAKPRLEPRIETRRLILRPLRDSNLGDIVAGIGDLAVARMLSRVPHPYRLADAEAFLDSTQQSVSSGRSLVLVIERGGRLIGGIGMPSRC